MAILTRVIALFLAASIPNAARGEISAGEVMPVLPLTRADGSDARIDPSKTGVIAIEFWASWCVACRETLPALARLAAERRSDGFRALAVNIDRSPAAAEAFLSNHLAANRDALEILYDPGGEALADLGAAGLPALYVVDHGVVRLVQGGWEAGGDQRLRRVVDVLLQRRALPQGGTVDHARQRPDT